MKNALSGSAASGLKDYESCDKVYKRNLRARFKLSKIGAAQRFMALEWNASKDAYEFADSVQTLVQIAYPRLTKEQVKGQSIKEIQQALPNERQTLIWELSQRPHTTFQNVVANI